MIFQASDFTPAPDQAIKGFSAADFSQPSSTNDKSKDFLSNYIDPSGYADDINKLSNIGQNTLKRFDTLNNSRAQSPDEYAAQLKKERLFNSPTAITPQDLYLGIVPKTVADVGKIGVNGIIGGANLVKNVGGFLWNLNMHPVDTVTNVLADPVGFAEGLLPDWLKNTISGLATGFKDVMDKGDWKGAGQDMVDSAQKSVLAFYNDPVSNIVQTHLAGRLASEGVGEFAKPGENGGTGTQGAGLKGMASDFTGSLNKPLDIIKTAGKNISEKGVLPGVSDTVSQFTQPITSSIKNVLSGIGTTMDLFTRDGRAKIAGAQANDLLNLSKSFFDVQNYQEKLRTADISSGESEVLNTKIENAKVAMQQASQNLNSMAYKLVNFAKGAYDSNSFKTPTDFSDSLSGSLDTGYTTKDAKYKQAFFKGDGTPIPVDDVKPFTDALRAKADVLGPKGQDKTAIDRTRTFADALDLRQEIHKAGGVQQYLDSQVADRVAKTKPFGNATVPPEGQEVMSNQIRNEVTKELADKINKSGQDKSFFTQPITAYDLQQSSSAFFNNKIPDSNTSLNYFLNEGNFGAPVKGTLENTIKTNLERDNPDGYNYKKQADAKNTELSQIAPVFKGAKFSTIQEAIDFSKSHWEELKKMPDLLLQMQNTMASKIYSDAIQENTGTIDYTKINSGLNKYGSYLRPEQAQLLREASLYPKLGDVLVSDKNLSSTMKQMLGMNTDVQTQETSIADMQKQLEQVKYNQETVGTDPETIVRNIEGLKSEKDFNNFIQSSGIKDPLEIGKLYKQSVFENNKLPNGDIEIGGLVDTLKSLIDFGSKSKTYSKELQNQILGPGEKARYQTLLDTAKHTQKLLETVDSSQTGTIAVAKLTYAGIMAYLGFHVSASRMVMSAIHNNQPIKGSTSFSESQVRDMITEKVPESQRGWFSRSILPAKATNSAKETTDKIDAYLKSAESVMGHSLSTEERQALMNQYMTAGAAI